MKVHSSMQKGDLGVARLVRSAWRFGAGQPVFHWNGTDVIQTDMRQTAVRALRLMSVMAGEAVKRGDRIATFCGTTIEHLEAYLAIPASGAVLHALNVRMSDQDLADMVHAQGDKVLLLDHPLAERFATLAPLLSGSALRLVLVTGGGQMPQFDGWDVPVRSYEQALAEAQDVDPMSLEDLPEDQTAAICHTGGTTGQPKAVAYSHRAVWLQAMTLCTADSLALSRRDVALLAVPFYHVNGWGLPYAAMMAGAGLALPGATFKPEVLDRMMHHGAVTIAAGVPTIWTDLLKHLTAMRGALPPTLTRLATGGAVVPARLIESFEQRDVMVLQAWGMTETCSMSVVGRATRRSTGAGQPPLGFPGNVIELRVVGPDGNECIAGSDIPGEVQARGATVIREYLGADAPGSFDGEWLRTGDIGLIDRNGALTLTDRLKDAIKSGGEWIPAPMLEDALRSLDGIADAAVIACPDERFQERPLAVLVLDDAATIDPDTVRAKLRDLVPSWWIPDRLSVLPELPRTTLGKPDKLILRQMLQAGTLPDYSQTTSDSTPQTQLLNERNY